MVKNPFKCLIAVLVLCLIASCAGPNKNGYSDTTKEAYTTVEISDNEVIKFNPAPLTILYIAPGYWGTPRFVNDNLVANFIKLSELCEENFGFPIKFVNCGGPPERNNYAVKIQSGESGDLVFPVRYVNMKGRTSSNDFWGDQYIQEGLYMDLSPYLDKFCPEAIVNFSRYPQIKNLCTKEDKIYAVYAGMPDINVLSLFVKNSVLEENNIIGIRNFESLFDVMHNMYQGQRDIPDQNRILVDYGNTLLDHVIWKNGYYPLYKHGYGYESNIVLKQDDLMCKPYLIEDTGLFHELYKEFSRFFEDSYFITKPPITWVEDIGSYDLLLTQDPLNRIRTFSKNISHDVENIFKYYSIFLFEEAKYIVSSPGSILFVMVPNTSRQPEKALYLMNWLMTDQDVADILTFGSNIMNLKHYRYSEDGAIIPEKDNLIYGYYNLVANFTEKAFLCGNEAFDISKTYREMTFHADIPPLYKKITNQHIYLDYIQDLCVGKEPQFHVRHQYIEKAIIERISNPESSLTPDDMEKGLFEVLDSEAFLGVCSETIKQIMKSGIEIYGD